MYLPDNRTIEILAQVVYKELCENWRRHGDNLPDIRLDNTVFWNTHETETLNLARNIVKVQQQINKPKPYKDTGTDVTKTSEIPFNK